MPKLNRNTFIYFKHKPSKEERKNCKLGVLKDERTLKEYNRRQKERERKSRSLCLFETVSPIDHDENDFDPFPKDLGSDEERTLTFWEEDLDKWVSLYLRALGRGKPNATLTTPIAIPGSCA
ncbi:hypothetical protein MFLAVUS_000343 [Mucor flavus]|uniref:Uncharacterized protein n=1 Tax=Mucor flavus TaxID=439312 RepID=A0ABP9YJG3_9FUNG